MPRDFKNFSQNQQKTINQNQEKVNQYEDIINKYKNMSNNELMQNLFNEATKLKQQGKLDSASLNSLKTTIAPFLNNDQQEMLNNLISAINEQK